MLLKPTTIYVDIDGNVQEQSRKTIYRYSDLNEIRLVTPLAIEGGMRVNFLLGNGVTIEQKTMTASTQKEVVGSEEWNVFTYRPSGVIMATLTSQNVGTLQMSFTQIVVVEGKQFGNTFGTTTLTINPTIEGPEPTLEDATTLNTLESQISALTSALASKVDESLTGYTTLSVIDEDASFVYVNYNGGSYKVSLQQWINLVNTQFTTLVSRVESLEDKVDQDVSIGATPSFNTVEATDFILRDATSGHKAKLEYDDANDKVVFTGELSGGNESFTYDLNQSLKTTDDVEFAEVTAETLVLDGKAISWNEVDGTFDIALNGEVLQVGQETHFYGKAVGDIVKGDVVMFADQQGDHILFTKATGAGLQAFPQAIMGVATTNINNNQFGYVSWFGKVRDLAPAQAVTEEWGLGAILYVSPTTGQLTDIVPTAPQKIIQVAAVIHKNPAQFNDYDILVRPHFIETALLDQTGIIDADYLDSSIIKGVSFGGTSLTFTKVDDTTFTVSLADLSEDAELISSGALVEDGGSKFLEFTRQNDTTFRINVDAFFDDTDTNKFVQSVAIENDIITFTYNDTSTTTLSLVGLYEPAFTKNSAFNKNFTTSGGGTNGEFGTAETVARGDHLHSQYVTFNDVATLPSTVTQQEWDAAYGHISLTNNPHSVTATQVGLGNVTNSSDADKPVSTLQQVQFDKVNNATEFITATNTTASDFFLTLTNGLTPNAILTVKFPASAADDTQQARLSIDGGTAFFIIQNSTGADLLGSAVTGKTLSVVYSSGTSRFVTLRPQEIAYTAFGWGDHGQEGYLTTESDPTVPSHVKSITETNISNWDTAYGWGDHSTEGYLTSVALNDLSDVDVGDVQDGQTLVYNAIAQGWLPGEGGGGASVTISDTAPSPAEEGDLWFDSTTATLYIYYNDGTSTQWVEVTYDQDYAQVAFYTTTILAADTWTDQTGYFTLAKTISGILSTDKPIVDLDLSTADPANVADIQTAWATIYRVVATANTITFYALEDPTFPEDTVISLQVVR